MGVEKNMFTTEDFELVKINDKYAELRTKNIMTGEMTATGITVLFDDIDFSSRLSTAIAEIAESASAINSVDTSEYDSILDKINSSDKVNEENKSIMSMLIKMQSEILKVQAVSQAAKTKFDNALGEGSLDSVVKARFGKVFLPNVVFIGSLLSFLTNAGSALIASELTTTLNSINERFKDV